MITAIETYYQGYHFRSRLEARWAVFFTALGIRWIYEPQGYLIYYNAVDDRNRDISKKWSYLPDFYLPELGTWVEIKGSLENVTDEYLHMMACAVDWDGQLPGIKNSLGTSRGLLWLGNIPDIIPLGTTQLFPTPIHSILQHCKGGYVMPCQFLADAGLEIGVGDNHLQKINSGDYFDSTFGQDECARILRESIACDHHFLWQECDTKLAAAYQDARQARF